MADQLISYINSFYKQKEKRKARFSRYILINIQTILLHFLQYSMSNRVANLNFMGCLNRLLYVNLILHFIIFCCSMTTYLTASIHQ